METQKVCVSCGKSFSSPYPQQKYCGSNVKKQGCSYVFRSSPKGFKTDLSTPRRCTFPGCDNFFIPNGARSIYCGSRKKKEGCSYKQLLINKKKDRDSFSEEDRAKQKLLKRNSLLRKEYGINVNIYNTMLIQQKYKCDICGLEEAKNNNGVLCVDHDHTTGKVRGLLCQHCNTGIGMFFESVERIINALKYLDKWKKN